MKSAKGRERGRGGIDDAVAALAKGGIPDDLSDHEKIAVRLARDLSIHHRVDDALYGAAEKAFGRTGLFDIVLVMGLYQTVCTALTLFECPRRKPRHRSGPGRDKHRTLTSAFAAEHRSRPRAFHR